MASFRVDSLEEATQGFGKPEILNTDQGSQFTSDSFTAVLLKNDIKISMDGRGQALDNIVVERLWRSVKYEEVYLKKHENMQDLLMGLTHYFMFYNNERRHQSLGYQTPESVYRTGVGGGAKIVDTIGGAIEGSSVALRSTDGSSAAEAESTPATTSTAEATQKPGQRHAAVAEKALS